MKAVIHYLKFGLISGLIMCTGWLVFHLFILDGETIDFASGEIYGYGSMLIAYVTVFFGIRKYRNDSKDGQITFLEAFKVGTGIVFVASLVYVIAWMIYYPNFFPDFIERYISFQVSALENQGLSAAELSEKKAEMQEMGELYKNPFAVIGLTFLEVFPLGLVVATICSLILKRK